MADRIYTLDEAVDELRLRECKERGHDIEQLTDGTGEPLALVCALCGRKWKVEPIE